MTADDLYQAIGETNPEYLEQSETCAPRHTRKVVLRSMLIAAVIAAAGCMTALAVTFSLRDAARADMGISEVNPIPEWTEYEGVKTADAETEDAEQTPVQVALAATMCSGRQIYAYLEVSPIDAELAAALANNTSSEYEWDLGGFQPKGCSYYVEQIGYDAETQTALVKAELSGDVLEQTEQMELKLYLKHDFQQEAAYGPVVIPITEAQMLSCTANVTVRNVKAHLNWEEDGLNVADCPDYVSEGTIKRISICAGYIEVELETPSLEQWVPATGLDQAELTESFIEDLFFCSWYTSVNEALAGATIQYKDGTSQVIDEIPSIYAGIWLPSDGKVEESVYEGKNVYLFTPQKAFDLSTVKSITMGGVEYSFPAVD